MTLLKNDKLSILDCPILDCRNTNDYCLGHIQGATSLPANELFTRMHELPQRQIPLQLCGHPQDIDAARTWLKHREFVIAQEILWSESLRESLLLNGHLETGAVSARLWQPSPLIVEFIEQIQPQHHFAAKTGLDIACGAGRDMVYLAMHHWQMTGIDYSAEALQRAQQLARVQQVNINTLQLDLENNSNSVEPQDYWLNSHFDLICVFRYLHRPLLPLLKNLLNPGGFIIYQTFMTGCEKIGSPRNPRFLLQENELADIFADFTLLKNDIHLLDDKRPVSAFIARKSY